MPGQPEDHAKRQPHEEEPEYKISYSPRDGEGMGSEMHMVPTTKSRLRLLIDKLRGH
jgi:hypothetical protein